MELFVPACNKKNLCITMPFCSLPVHMQLKRPIELLQPIMTDLQDHSARCMPPMVAEYQSVEELMADREEGMLLDRQSGARTHALWTLEHAFHDCSPTSARKGWLGWRVGEYMTKQVSTRKPIIYHVLRLQREGELSRAEAIAEIDHIRITKGRLKNGKRVKQTISQLSSHLAATQQKSPAFQQEYFGWPDDSFRSCKDGKNPVRLGKRKAA